MNIEDLLSGDGLQQLMGQAQQMQQQVQDAKERAAAREVVGESGGGMVKVTANGRLEIVKVELDPEVVDRDDVAMLEDLVVAAANAALTEARRVVEQELGPLSQALQASGLSL